MAERDVPTRADVRRSDDAMPPRPTWVKVFGIAFVVVAVVFAILHLAGKGPQSHMHGPIPSAPPDAKRP